VGFSNDINLLNLSTARACDTEVAVFEYKHCGVLIAITFFAVFGLMFATSLTLKRKADLPACCRRNGKLPYEEHGVTPRIV